MSAVAALKIALVNSKEFQREVKDGRCYSQESLYSQDNNLVRLTKADDRRITRMKTSNTNHTCDTKHGGSNFPRRHSGAREVTKQLVTSGPSLTYYCTAVVTSA